MAIHVAQIVLVQIDSVTQLPFTKDTSKMNAYTSPKSPTTTRPRDFSTEFRILPDAAIPNSAGYPTIPAYLTLEAGSSYKFAHMDQTYVITQT